MYTRRRKGRATLAANLAADPDVTDHYFGGEAEPEADPYFGETGTTSTDAVGMPIIVREKREQKGRGTNDEPEGDADAAD